MMMMSTRSPIVGILLVAGVTMVHAATEPAKPLVPYKAGDMVRLMPKNANNSSQRMKDIIGADGKAIPWVVEFVEATGTKKEVVITVRHPAISGKSGLFKYTLIKKKGNTPDQWKGPALDRDGRRAAAWTKIKDGPRKGKLTGEKKEPSKSFVRCVPEPVSKTPEDTPEDTPESPGMGTSSNTVSDWTPIAEQLVERFASSKLILHVRRFSFPKVTKVPQADGTVIEVSNMDGNQPFHPLEKRYGSDGSKALMRIVVTKCARVQMDGLPVVQVKIVDLGDVESACAYGINLETNEQYMVKGKFCKAEDDSLWLLRTEVLRRQRNGQMAWGNWPIINKAYRYDLKLTHANGEPIKLGQLKKFLK